MKWNITYLHEHCVACEGLADVGVELCKANGTLLEVVTQMQAEHGILSKVRHQATVMSA
jgi:hypothetical protein